MTGRITGLHISDGGVPKLPSDLAIDLHKKNILKRILVISSSMVFETTNVYPTPETEIKAPPRLCKNHL